MDKAAGKLVQKTLGDGLGLPIGLSDYVTFRDYVTNLEYIRSCRELVERGLYVELGAYQCHVFLDFRFASGEQWKAVCEALNGAGVPSVQGKFDEMFAPKREVKEDKQKKIRQKTTRTGKKATGGRKNTSTKPKTKKQPLLPDE